MVPAWRAARASHPAAGWVLASSPSSPCSSTGPAGSSTAPSCVTVRGWTSSASGAVTRCSSASVEHSGPTPSSRCAGAGGSRERRGTRMACARLSGPAVRGTGAATLHGVPRPRRPRLAVRSRALARSHVPTTPAAARPFARWRSLARTCRPASRPLLDAHSLALARSHRRRRKPRRRGVPRPRGPQFAVDARGAPPVEWPA